VAIWVALWVAAPILAEVGDSTPAHGPLMRRAAASPVQPGTPLVGPAAMIPTGLRPQAISG